MDPWHVGCSIFGVDNVPLPPCCCASVLSFLGSAREKKRERKIVSKKETAR